MPRAHHSPFSTGIAGRCPACGEGSLFDGVLEFAKDCEACGEDFTMDDTGDGPAFFVMSLVSFIIVPMAIAFHFLVDAPTWLTMLIWVPVIVIASIAMLRPMRGVMFNTQWVNQARQVGASDIKK